MAMTEVETIKEQLVRMPRRAYGELLRQVDRARRAEAERQEAVNPIRPDMTRDEFANWIARRNYDFDPGIVRIVYFPTGAPPDEVRLLECNELTPYPEGWPLRAYPFDVDLDDVEFKVYVADVAPSLVPEVLAGHVGLPSGWMLDGYQEFTFDDR
jgi:hypothetical protein